MLLNIFGGFFCLRKAGETDNVAAFWKDEATKSGCENQWRYMLLQHFDCQVFVESCPRLRHAASQYLDNYKNNCQYAFYVPKVRPYIDLVQSAYI